jgi:hypothetical protein
VAAQGVVWTQMSKLVPAWLLERLQVFVDVLKVLDEKIAQAKAAFVRSCRGPRPKGVGALSQMQLQSGGAGLVAL